MAYSRCSEPPHQRLQKTVGGSTTDFLYDGVNPVQELSGGSPSANLLTGLGIDEYFTRGTETLLTDALGSTIALTDAAGTVQTEYTYEPFGVTTATGSGSANRFLYTGRENDDTGLYYYRARYYDPTLERFISEDPIGLKGGVNLYGYVTNNPIAFTDPFGLCADPGGPGIRYCVDSFIPHLTVLLLGKGDNRGPNPHGGDTFRTRQLIRAEGTVSSEPGTSETWIPGFRRIGTLGDCDATVRPLPLGGRKIVAWCSGINGFGLPPWPLSYRFAIREVNGRAEVVSASGTTFPSFEIWQYGGPDGTRRVYYFPTPGNVLDLGYGVKPLPIP